MHSIFSVIAGLMVKMLFMLFSVYNTANELKMSEYEVHWLLDFPLIIYWAHQEISMVISEKKQANKNKEKLAILLSIGIIVVRKQGSPIPADTLMGI